MVRARLPLAVVAIVAAVGLAIAAAVLSLWLWSPGSDAVGGGPLAHDGVAAGSGFIKDAGEAVSLAGIEVTNPGTDPIVLEHVGLVDPDQGIRLVGALAGQRTTLGRFEAAPGFPPRQPDDLPASVFSLPEVAPLEGYVVPPQPGVALEDQVPTQLFIGLESTSPEGRVTLQSFELYYRVEPEAVTGQPTRFRLLIPYAVAICTPRVEYSGIKPCGAFLPGEDE